MEIFSIRVRNGEHWSGNGAGTLIQMTMNGGTVIVRTINGGKVIHGMYRHAPAFLWSHLASPSTNSFLSRAPPMTRPFRLFLSTN